jgi:glycine hydroxymethyltransferase
MHAGKNVMSRKARQLLSSAGLVDNGVSGAVGSRNATGVQYIDDIEFLTIGLLKKLFKARAVEYRAMSGSLANGIALIALTEPGDTIMVVSRKNYGHYSYGPEGYPRPLGLRVEEIPYTDDGSQIDPDAFRLKAEALQPRLIIVGTSIFLFPAPLTEIRRIADAVGAKVLYDGAHVLGLIAGGQFQDPLSEGADLLVGSTQKTLPGPIGGILACNDSLIAERISWATNVLFSNYCNNRVAAMALSAAEMLQYGRNYAERIAGNAIALAQALDEEGLPVLGQEKGYTASHQVLLDATGLNGAKAVADILEKVNIICTRFALSSDYPDRVGRPNGVRLGVSAVSRLGMGTAEMRQISRWIRQALDEPQAAEQIREHVKALASRFRVVHYSFD